MSNSNGDNLVVTSRHVGAWVTDYEATLPEGWRVLLAPGESVRVITETGEEFVIRRESNGAVVFDGTDA